VINALDQARLVVIDAGAGDRRRMVRVAHEALLTHWPRARTLFEAHAVALALKEDLERSAIRWKNEGEDKVFLIPGGRPLAEAQVLLADGRVALTKLAGAYINASLAEHRVAIENVKAQLARDEQKIADHLKSAEYREAEIELQSVVGYLSEETDIDLRDRAARFTEQLGRMSRLAIFSTAARSVYSLAGEENFEKAPGVCESALRAIGMFDDPEWWEHLPVEGLEPGQIEDLRQDIYRSLLLFSALQLVPGIRKLFPGRQAGPPKPRRSIDPTKFARLIPNFVLAAIIRRGGFGSFRLPTRRDNPQARVEFDNSLAVLKQVWRVEEARAKEAGRSSQRSRASYLVERIAQVLAEFSSGPKGASVDYERWLLAAAPAEPPEPVNAVDYFFIGLFNYYIAKRSDDAAVAKIISLLQGSFPDLDARAPLATAERLLRTAIALEPRNFWPHWVLGRTLLQGGAPAAAELAFNAAIALQPDYARGYEQRALALANQWAEVGDDRLRNRARDDSRKALAVAKGDPSVFWPRGEMLERLGEIREAVGAYSLWLELEDDLLAKIARGAGVVRLYELALKLLADTSAVGLHADAHALLALVYWTWKDYKSDASRAAASALAIDPAHPHALAVTGVVLLELGRVSEALDRGLEPALRFDPHNDWVLLNRARAVELEYGSEAALAAWQRLLDRAATVTAPCPPWMKDVAEAAVSRIGAAMRAPQPQTAVA
jgi:tetratricopeptide (TPR) repeat protein